MTQPAPNARAQHERRHGIPLGIAGRAVLPILLSLAAPARAADGEWSLLLEPMFMDAFGHDQHVLTIHERAFNVPPPLNSETVTTPVNLDTDNGLAPRLEIRYARAHWTFGVDFFWFDTSQGRPSRTAAGGVPVGTASQVDFEAADRTFISVDPGSVLFFQVLEDTDLIAWTADLYAMKTLLQTPQGSLALQFGLRNADFDNDYHHAVGVESVEGSLFDASSNYPRMIGPLLGLSGEVQYGKSTFRGYFGQSVIFGTAELSNQARDFTGPLSDAPTIVRQTFLTKGQDVAIPITEFRVNWLYPIARHVSLGVSANTSVWWDVPVPPGVIPITDGDELFHENTILYFGLALAVKLRL